ncbi:MAG: hypothetical protein C0624_08300 [Desulfuromonas sp.]|nr:MAG: hypothetical protein C0624_08300 [Desulfuromonas sp.]
MAKEELLKAMKRQARQELEELRRESREHHARLRSEYAARLRLAREQLSGHHHLAFRQKLENDIQQCVHAQREKLTEHRARLEQRCRNLARQTMEKIWQTDRERLFSQLQHELPPLNWSRYRVSPVDLELAKKLFTKIPVKSDPDIRGGLVAECTERNMIVDATLETLLERMWPGLVPELIESIAHECREESQPTP